MPGELASQDLGRQSRDVLAAAVVGVALAGPGHAHFLHVLRVAETHLADGLESPQACVFHLIFIQEFYSFNINNYNSDNHFIQLILIVMLQHS